MSAALLVVLAFLGSIWLQVSATGVLGGVSPLWQLLAMVLFVVRWRGLEVHFIAVALGLGADLFSSLPFGVNGLAYFLASFPLRYLSIKVLQGGVMVIPFITATVALGVKLVLVLLAVNLEGISIPGWHWWTRLLLFELLPTALLAAPLYQALLAMEFWWGIRLSERKQ